MAISHSVGQMVYPEDLLKQINDSYGGNYVLFNINVHNDSKLVSSGGAPVTDVPIKPREAGEITGKNIGSGAATSALVAATAVGGAKLAKQFSATPLSQLAGAALGGLSGGAAANAVGAGTAAYKQLVATIALHIPVDLGIKYRAEWREADTAMVAGAIQGADVLGGNVSDFFSYLTSGSKAGPQSAGLIDIMSGMAGNVALSNNPIGDVIGKMSGVAANPKKELLFKNMDFRSFTFTYDFNSRSPAETEAIHKIIKTFKYHMHPEFKSGTANFLYVYPSEFEIAYHLGAGTNQYLHKHTSCVLTDMDVKYNPHGQNVAHADGSPITIRIILSFKELAILTRDKIEEGY